MITPVKQVWVKTTDKFHLTYQLGESRLTLCESTMGSGVSSIMYFDEGSPLEEKHSHELCTSCLGIRKMWDIEMTPDKIHDEVPESYLHYVGESRSHFVLEVHHGGTLLGYAELRKCRPAWVDKYGGPEDVVD